METPLEEVSILALLPSYLERNSSSLVYMVNKLLPQAHGTSGFFLDNFDALHNQLVQNESKGLKTLLIGVSFALLDFSVQFPMVLKHHGNRGNEGKTGRAYAK